MVYLGKPSKGCGMCRQRRIKCDETKPTCNQCAKARRQCPGYRDEFDIVLRIENQAARRRALKLGSGRRRKNASTPSSTSSDDASSSSSSSPPSSTSSISGPRTQLTPTERNLSLTQQLQRRTPPPSVPANLSLPLEEVARCHFMANFVLLPGKNGSHGFMEYLIPLLAESPPLSLLPPSPPASLSSRSSSPTATTINPYVPFQHAFNACALAWLGNRVGRRTLLPSPVPSPPPHLSAEERATTPGQLIGRAFGEYARALRAMQTLLKHDPQRAAASDAVLASVLLLGLFESISARRIGDYAWGSHTLGAVQLVKTRGRSLLKTRVGWGLWVGVRIQMIIYSLTSGNTPDMGTEWWMSAGIVDSTAAECQRLNLETGELRAEATRVMAAAVERTPATTAYVQSILERAKQLDARVAEWMRNVPFEWRYETIWPENIRPLGGMSMADLACAEVFPDLRRGVDVYRDFSTAASWNLARTTRLILWSIAVRCAAWIGMPQVRDWRQTEEYLQAKDVASNMVADIIASVPYHLRWKGINCKQDLGFAVGNDDAPGVRGLGAYFLTWPLACVMTQDYATEEQRAYVRGRLNYIGDECGIKYAHILAQLNFRIPSMLIRSDGLMAKPFPKAYDFEKLVSAPPPQAHSMLVGQAAAPGEQTQDRLAALAAMAVGQMGPTEAT